MVRKHDRFSTRSLVVVLGVGLCASTSAFGGGGRGGDSSMNPFTGDSYAYFNGGHNLGEQAMIIPWRSPPQSSPQNVPSKRADSSRATAPSTPPPQQKFYPPPRDSNPPRE
jgi:hypothetical protein